MWPNFGFSANTKGCLFRYSVRLLLIQTPEIQNQWALHLGYCIGIICGWFEHQPLILEMNCCLPKIQHPRLGPVCFFTQARVHHRTEPPQSFYESTLTFKGWKRKLKQRLRGSCSTEWPHTCVYQMWPWYWIAWGTKATAVCENRAERALQDHGGWTEPTAKGSLSHLGGSAHSSPQPTVSHTAFLKTASIKTQQSFPASCQK